MLQGLNIRLSPVDARRVYNYFDHEHDGSISYHSFCRVVFPAYNVESLSYLELHKNGLRALERLSNRPGYTGGPVAISSHANGPTYGSRLTRGNSPANSRRTQSASDIPFVDHQSVSNALNQISQQLGSLQSAMQGLDERMKRIEERTAFAV